LSKPKKQKVIFCYQSHPQEQKDVDPTRYVFDRPSAEPAAAPAAVVD
jgi:hypothetical protein